MLIQRQKRLKKNAGVRGVVIQRQTAVSAIGISAAAKLVILTKKTLAVTLEHRNTPMMSCAKMIVQVLQSGLQLRGSQLVAKEEENNESD